MKSLLITVLTILGMATMTMAQIPSYIPSDSLIGWWPFNGNANDESGNGLNGSTVGGVSLTQDRNGTPNSAYSFDGIDDYIISPNSSSYLSDTISLSFWVNYNADFSYFSLIAFGGAPSIRWGATCGFTSLRAAVGSVCGGTGNLLNYNTSVGWHNVVYVIAGTNQNIYYDGNYVGTENNSIISSLGCDNSNLWFGVDIASVAEYYNGKLDDIGIWNRALTQQEITEIYNGTSVGIIENSRSELFSVFPNPAQSVINVKAETKLKGQVYSIYDNTGRVVLSGKLNSENTTIELGNLSGGIYMFSVGDNMKQSFKVIKE